MKHTRVHENSFVCKGNVMPAPTYQLSIVRGKTLEQTLLYADSLLEYRAISAVTSLAPLRLTVTGHGIPDGWPCRIQGVATPSEMNTTEGVTYPGYVVDADTLEFNSLDGSGWAAFVPSGHVVFVAPGDLTGWKLRMQVRASIGGPLLLSLSSDPADGAVGIITVDAANSAFTLKLTAAQTAALDWAGGIYDIEGIRPDGAVVSLLAPSVVVVEQEVTVWE